MFAILFESEQDRERRRILAVVSKTVDAHRLKKMKEFLAYEQLATWRKMNDFDRIAADKNQGASRPLPLTPEQFIQSLWSMVNALKDAISMSNEHFASPKRSVEKRGREEKELWQNTMDVVDGLRNDSLDELLANFEFARIKEYVKKRSREAAQVQMTVTQVDTVQHSNRCPLDPEPSLSVYVKLENTEGKMGTELEEFISPSPGTGLETSGQQCPPNKGTWDQGHTTTSGILTAGVRSSQRKNISSPTNGKRGQTSERHENY